MMNLYKVDGEKSIFVSLKYFIKIEKWFFLSKQIIFYIYFLTVLSFCT